MAVCWGMLAVVGGAMPVPWSGGLLGGRHAQTDDAGAAMRCWPWAHCAVAGPPWLAGITVYGHFANLTVRALRHDHPERIGNRK